MDHWMLAPPHGFSQLAASFFACPRPGIPRVPLLRLTSSLRSRDHRETESGRAASLPMSSRRLRTGPPYVFDTPMMLVELLDDPNHPNCQRAGAARSRARDPLVAQGCTRYENRAAGQARTAGSAGAASILV